MKVTINAQPVADDAKSEEPSKWEVDCWVRTLLEAAEIKADPEKMNLVTPALALKKKALDEIVPVKSMKDLKAAKAKLDALPDEEY